MFKNYFTEIFLNYLGRFFDQLPEKNALVVLHAPLPKITITP